MTSIAPRSVPTGIVPLDERIGGLDAGGCYLVVGAPGPAKLVALLQYLQHGITRGERCLLVTNADAASILEVAAAWGFDMSDAWRSEQLQIIGFRDDFELRAIRSIEPEEVLEELDDVIVGEPDRIAVDPGSLFLTGGARTLLGAAFVVWARERSGTVLTTFSVDGPAGELPSSADWLVGSTTGRLVLEPRSGGLYQITLRKALPAVAGREETVSLKLEAGTGLTTPDAFPDRRDGDRGNVDTNRLLLVTLGPAGATDIETWTARAFDTDLVSEPFEAVATVQHDARYGCVLLNAPRQKVREAVQACRALRPLTRAAIVFASDEAIRSTDRIQLLEAGADDCLSGGLDFRELGLRIRQSMASGAKTRVEPDAAGATPPPVGGPVDAEVSLETFEQEIERRGADPDHLFFSVLSVSSAVASASELRRQLVALVRSDEGDLVTVVDDRCLALLQGAREGQLDAFLDRLRSRLDEAGAGRGAELTVELQCHPGQAAEIVALLGTAVGQTA